MDTILSQFYPISNLRTHSSKIRFNDLNIFKKCIMYTVYYIMYTVNCILSFSCPLCVKCYKHGNNGELRGKNN
jgi:hypothetical protein